MSADVQPNEDQQKSSVDQIRERFDRDVERFSNLETGQTSTMDASLVMDLICRSAARVTPLASDLLDIGCGAGNYSLKILEYLPRINVTLVDLSQPMLQRAGERLSQAPCGKITCNHTDIRDFSAPEASFDLIIAAAVFHHLRNDEEWHSVFTNLYRWLRPGGSLWISDLVDHDVSAIRELMQERYGEYLTGLKDETYRDFVFDYIKKEDTPRSLNFQMDLLHQVGFSQPEVLHKNTCFAAFGGMKQEKKLFRGES